MQQILPSIKIIRNLQEKIDFISYLSENFEKLRIEPKLVLEYKTKEELALQPVPKLQISFSIFIPVI
ncbi:hypothetical protein TTHERM_001060821 (macronuclear) [Tetrahymena thermophila SB210]|uniref:Uncharacterized protein n=1 Tax=Tetrahymena thermophila (strain SB210) TaxID=312017 RepID=W7XKS0_TETTS|nr:hypothetical protein TTHERM_001060821 [Tetrahymena thermophila SB210]EWS76766.1 hypothetical protein TTHERM_001060821 [Tetrahymena thermophila SB210]|eukprot:XP_012650697.1 hypothetical protein TTHERM_001060821 [Tetrahymena thermophila SB210]